MDDYAFVSRRIPLMEHPAYLVANKNNVLERLGLIIMERGNDGYSGSNPTDYWK